MTTIVLTPITSTSYSTVALVKVQAGIATADTSLDAWITAAITAASRAIDKFCRRHFYTEVDTRYYDFPGGDSLWLDHDLVSITTLTNGDGTTLTESTDFLLWPYFGPPFARIDIKTDSGTPFVYSATTQKAISVAGSWGYQTTVPSEIEAACKTWVSMMINQRQAAGVSSKTIGGFSVSFTQNSPDAPPPEVAVMLKPFVRRRFLR
jgi:hypothetical protein